MALAIYANYTISTFSETLTIIITNLREEKYHKQEKQAKQKEKVRLSLVCVCIIRIQVSSSATVTNIARILQRWSLRSEMRRGAKRHEQTAPLPILLKKAQRDQDRRETELVGL